MKTIKAVLCGIFIFAVVCKAQDDTNKFRYRAARAIPVGTVLHYVKTNIDGSKPEYVSQYIAAENVMESFKFHPKETPAGFVVAEMDWRSFSAKTLKSWQIISKGEHKFFGTIIFDAQARRAEISLPSIKSETESFAFKQVPIHLYNFDFGSLNFAFPHLVKLSGSFVIGVADPTFQENGALAEYKGEVTISYEGSETRNKALTRKYRIDGAGLKNRGGFIWVNKKYGWIEDMEIAQPDNPNWNSFKFNLLRTEKMSRAAWDNFMNAQL